MKGTLIIWVTDYDNALETQTEAQAEVVSRLCQLHFCDFESFLFFLQAVFYSSLVLKCATSNHFCI